MQTPMIRSLSTTTESMSYLLETSLLNDKVYKKIKSCRVLDLEDDLMYPPENMTRSTHKIEPYCEETEELLQLASPQNNCIINDNALRSSRSVSIDESNSYSGGSSSRDSDEINSLDETISDYYPRETFFGLNARVETFKVYKEKDILVTENESYLRMLNEVDFSENDDNQSTDSIIRAGIHTNLEPILKSLSRTGKICKRRKARIFRDAMKIQSRYEDSLESSSVEEDPILSAL